MSELIKVHVTEEQREMLEFLVTRRVNDIINQTGITFASHSAEYCTLMDIRKELQHAGT